MPYQAYALQIEPAEKDMLGIWTPVCMAQKVACCPEPGEDLLAALQG